MIAKIIRVTKGCLWRARCILSRWIGRRAWPCLGNDNDRSILFIDQRVPRGDEDAGSRQMLAYLKLFARNGYRVIFWSYQGNDDPGAVRTLTSIGIQVLKQIPHLFSFENMIRATGKHIQVAFLSRPHIAVRYLNSIKSNSPASVVYYGHDLHLERMNLQNKYVSGSFPQETVELVRAMEEECWANSNVILYPSVDEVEHLREKFPDQIVDVLPMECCPDDEIDHEITGNRFDDRDGLLFVGGFSHLPNQDAVLWFLKDIYPRMTGEIPNLKITIAGNGPTTEIMSMGSNLVKVTGRVSEQELRSLYNEVKVVIAPLRIGAGVKGKVVEALRSGVPVVTTTIGIQGLPGAGDAVMVADDPLAFIRSVVELYQNETLWAKRREEGLKYFKNNFSQSVVAEKVLRFLNSGS